MEIRASKRTINRLKQIQSLLDQLNPDAAPQALIVPGSPVPQGTIIVFPGSFNPPTNAHLALMSQSRQYVRSHLLSAGERELNDLLNNPENSKFARCIHPLPFGAAYRDFSSTRIRQNPEAHLQDVPQEVRRFIRETRAYDQPERMPDGSQVDYYGERM